MPLHSLNFIGDEFRNINKNRRIVLMFWKNDQTNLENVNVGRYSCRVPFSEFLKSKRDMISHPYSVKIKTLKVTKKFETLNWVPGFFNRFSFRGVIFFKIVLNFASIWPVLIIFLFLIHMFFFRRTLVIIIQIGHRENYLILYFGEIIAVHLLNRACNVIELQDMNKHMLSSFPNIIYPFFSIILKFIVSFIPF